jgi:hypothetical protein
MREHDRGEEGLFGPSHIGRVLAIRGAGDVVRVCVLGAGERSSLTIGRRNSIPRTVCPDFSKAGETAEPRDPNAKH